MVITLLACSSPGVVCGESGPRLWIENLPLASPRFSPKWTPDGGSIIFSGPTNHGGNIYVVSSDGSNLRRISKSKGNVYELDYTPDISPGGDRIVHATSRHGGNLWDNNRRRNFEIETTDFKGDDRKRLTENRWNDRLPIWTTDGEHIAFLGMSPHDHGSGGIIVMNADGSDARLLVPLTVPNPAEERDYRYFAVRWFAWSPNGDALALSLVDLNFPQVEFLEVASPDGSDPRRIFATPAKEIQGSLGEVAFGEILRDPAWSPDGSRLAFLYHHKDHRENDFDGCGNNYPRLTDLQKAEIEGQRWLEAEERLWPHSSSNGVASTAAPVGTAPGTYLCIVDVSGSGITGIQISPYRGSSGTSFSWSPDGRRVLFTEFRESGPLIYNNRWVTVIGTDMSFREFVGEIYIKSVDVTTGDSETVVRGVYASWSPDGSRIAVLGKYDDGGYLAIVAPDGSDFRVLVRADEDGDLKLTDD